MGNKTSTHLQDHQLEEISEETGFSPLQIERLHTRFVQLDRSNNGFITKADLTMIPELALNPLCERLASMFFIDSDEQHNKVTFREFVEILSTFGPPPTTFDRDYQHARSMRKLRFIFKIYDTDNDNKISFADLKRNLKLMVGSYIEEVQLEKIATRAFLEVDDNGDGFVDFDEFCKIFEGKDLNDKLRVKFY